MVSLYVHFSTKLQKRTISKIEEGLGIEVLETNDGELYVNPFIEYDVDDEENYTEEDAMNEAEHIIKQITKISRSAGEAAFIVKDDD